MSKVEPEPQPTAPQPPIVLRGPSVTRQQQTDKHPLDSLKRYLIGGCILIFLICLAALGVLVAVYLGVQKTQVDVEGTPQPPPPEQPIDQSEGGRLAGAQIFYGLNTSVNPCENFYEFVCGGWMEKNPATDEEPKRTAIDNMNQNLINNMANVLDKLSKAQRRKLDLTTWRGKSILFYRTCLKAAAEPKTSYDDIVGIVERFGGWPLINVTGEETEEIPKDFGGLSGTIFRETLSTGVFGTVKVYSSGRPSLQLVRQQLEHRTEAQLTTYQNEIRDAALLVAEHLGFTIDPAVLKAGIGKLVQLEQDLAAIPYNPVKTQITNVKKFAESYEQLGFQNYLEYMVTTEVYDALPDDFSTSVTAYTPDQLSSVESVLESYDDVVKRNWLITRFVLDFLTPTNGSDPFHPRNLHAQPDKEALCASTFLEFMDLAAGRLNAEYIASDQLKLDAKTIGSYILQAYHDEMANINWLDGDSKRRVYDKLNQFGISYAWPEWITDDLALDNWYDGVLAFNNESFAGIQRLLAAKKNERNFEFLINPPVKELDLFPMPLSTINGEYVPELNHLYVLAGILQPPFYSHDFPDVVNFGGLGMVIGHEMGHSFDRNGVNFDYQGQPNPILSQSTNRTFWQRTGCLVRQYNGYCLEDGTICEQGNVSITENEADVLGLRMAYHGYKKWLKDQGKAVRLPKLEVYNSDQLFFMNYGRSFCASYTKDMEKIESRMVHSISSARVLGATRNMPEFSEAFHCPTNSYMNAEEKCMIWSSENIV